MVNTDKTTDRWGARTSFAAGEHEPERADGFLVDGFLVDGFLVDGGPAEGVDRWVRRACLLCSNGCGVEVTVADDRMVGIRGRADDRINHGRLGPKGWYAWQGEQHGRLTTPLIRRVRGSDVTHVGQSPMAVCRRSWRRR